MIVWLMACAHTPAEILPAVRRTDPFVIEASARIAGLAIVVVEDDDWALQALTPTGLSLFTARANEEVIAPDEMKPILARLPFERDLWLLYRLRCADRCRTPKGHLRVKDGVGRWRGAGGPARVTTDGNAFVLRDPRRGYTLKVVVQ